MVTTDMPTDIIYDVDLAGDIQMFVMNNIDDIKFDSPDLRTAILKSDSNDLLRIGKIIGSLKIVSVDKVDAEFFKNNLFKK